MKYFSSVQESEDEDVKKLYNNLVEEGWAGSNENLPMNMFTYLGDRLDLLKWYSLAAQETLAGGKLPVALKQMVGLSLASRSNSGYCSHAHYQALEMLGVSKELIEQCAKGNSLNALSPVQRKVIEFSHKVADDSNSITDEDFKELEEIGLAKDEIIELILLVGLAHTMMIWTNVARIPKDG